ncbi:MAG: hypothetical protein ACF8R7_12085 [Phycisphaerales bacterium JB039]
MRQGAPHGLEAHTPNKGACNENQASLRRSRPAHGLLTACLMVLAAGPPDALAQTSASAARAVALREKYPDVRVYYPWRTPWGGAEQVTGARMGAAATARGAIGAWLDEYGAIFGPSAPEFAITNESELADGRIVVRFEQRIGEEAVGESHGRAVLAEGPAGWAVVYARCAALNVPPGGVARPLITAGEAKAIAATESRAARTGLPLTWSEPRRLIASNPEAEDPREARPMWATIGADIEWRIDPVQVVVDGLTGAVVRESPILARAFPPPAVSGTVSGTVLTGLDPYETQLACSSFSTQTQTIPRFRVELADEPGGAAVATTYTNNSGGYAFYGVSPPQDAVVRFVPDHQYFRLGVVESAVYLPGPVLDVEWGPIAGVEAAVPGVGSTVNYAYENNRGFGVDVEYEIGDMSAWLTVEQTRLFYKSELNPNQFYSGLDDDDLWVIVNEDQMSELSGIDKTAYFWDRDLVWLEFTFDAPVIVASAEGYSSTIGRDMPNLAYSTVVSHEYGHFALDEAFGINIRGANGNSGLHEGYAELPAILHHETDIIGAAGLGCIDSSTPKHVRDWTEIESEWTSAQNCQPVPYRRAQLLVLVWRSIRDAIGVAATSELFVEWSFLATPEPSPRYCYREGLSQYDSWDQSAREATLIEVLTADDTDNDITNGTPNEMDICAAFAAYGIEPDPLTHPDICDERAGTGCLVDFSGDGYFGIADILLFDQLMQARDERADLNRDGRFDLFDHLVLIDLGTRCIGK